MPPLTRERRQEMVKLLGKRTEDARIAIRNIRRSANDDIKMLEDEKEIGEDQAHRGRDQVQELTDQFIEKIEDAAKVKETDITEV